MAQVLTSTAWVSQAGDRLQAVDCRLGGWHVPSLLYLLGVI